MTTLPATNTASRIERSLTVAILRGKHAPGTRLPTVRALAASFDVTPATIQRALSRLEMTGLVATRQGSGTTVQDPAEHGDLSLVPAWLEATADSPERAAAILDDFLEVRRILAARLVVRHRSAILEGLVDLSAEAAALATATDLDALREADLRFARALLGRTGNTVATAVLNTAGRVLETVPGVAEAMYAQPEQNATAMLVVLRALGSGMDSRQLAELVEDTLAEVDRRTVDRFRARLQEAA